MDDFGAEGPPRARLSVPYTSRSCLYGSGYLLVTKRLTGVFQQQLVHVRNGCIFDDPERLPYIKVTTTQPEIDTGNTPPMKQAAWRLPFHLQEEVKWMLKRLEYNSITIKFSMFLPSCRYISSGIKSRPGISSFTDCSVWRTMSQRHRNQEAKEMVSRTPICCSWWGPHCCLAAIVQVSTITTNLLVNWILISLFVLQCNSVRFRSESPSQVFYILLQWLLSLVDSTGSTHRVPEVILAYDNMCNLARLNAAKEPLPFPAPLDQLWLKRMPALQPPKTIHPPPPHKLHVGKTHHCPRFCTAENEILADFRQYLTIADGGRKSERESKQIAEDGSKISLLCWQK